MADRPVLAVAVPGEWRGRFFPPATWARLEHLGTVTAGDGGHRPAFAALLGDADVVVTGWSSPALDAELLAGAPRLRLLAHTGATVKPYVTPASWARGVRVTQAGAGMADAVAESALGMTLALLHRLHRFDHGMHAGERWEELKRSTPPRRELRGCPVGVVGASRTGRAYLALVAALGADTTVYDPYLTADAAAALGTRLAPDLDTLLRGSRVVALHAPVLPETHHLLGTRELALMPDGALLVNTARSWLVDGEALYRELARGRLDAALDVYDTEPLPPDDPLRTLPNVLLTPHEAAGTVEARQRQGEIIVAEIARFLAGEPLLHEITEADLTRIG